MSCRFTKIFSSYRQTFVRLKCDKLFDSPAKSGTRDYTPGKFVLSKLSALVQNLMKN